MRKIFDYYDLTREKLVKFGRDFVLVGGCFDIFHYGHLIFLKKAKKLGGLLVVSLESDEFILRRKKRNPTHNQNQRARILAALSIVDMVIKLPYFKSNLEYANLVKLVKPRFIAITKGDPLTAIKNRQAKAVKGELKVVCRRQVNFSSTKIISGK